MQCPACENVTLVMSDRQGVEIDYCPQCRGVWLDRGELDKVIDRSAAMEGGPAPSGGARYSEDTRHRRDHDDDHRHHHRRKKKGFLGEMFDFE